MKPRDAFGLIVRTFGLAIVLYGLWNLLAAAQQCLAALMQNAGSNYIMGYAFYGTSFVVIGLVLLAGANLITRWCYGKEAGGPPPLPAGRKRESDELLA